MNFAVFNYFDRITKLLKEFLRKMKILIYNINKWSAQWWNLEHAQNNKS